MSEINCLYNCPCGANDKGGSKYPEGVCSLGMELAALREENDRLIEQIRMMSSGEEWRFLNERISRITQGNNKLRDDKRELVEALESIIRLKDIWLPENCNYIPEYEGECKALMSAYNKMYAAVAKHKAP